MKECSKPPALPNDTEIDLAYPITNERTRSFN